MNLIVSQVCVHEYELADLLVPVGLLPWYGDRWSARLSALVDICWRCCCGVIDAGFLLQTALIQREVVGID